MEALERRISNVGGNGNGTAESEDTVARLLVACERLVIIWVCVCVCV